MLIQEKGAPILMQSTYDRGKIPVEIQPKEVKVH